VPRLLPAFDVFVFPSLHEGLPLACVQAQAAGLRVLVSDSVTSEVCLLPHLVTRLSLSQGPSRWAAACLEVMQSRVVDARYALSVVSKSRYAIRQSAAATLAAYANAVAAVTPRSTQCQE
jgi:glycosyltransferase involved in cell wall biosynthesis